MNEVRQIADKIASPGIAGAAEVASERPPSRVEAEVMRLRGLMEKAQFTTALAGAQALLGEVPENRDVWYIIAVCQRYLQRIPEALSTLACTITPSEIGSGGGAHCTFEPGA